MPRTIHHGTNAKSNPSEFVDMQQRNYIEKSIYLSQGSVLLMVVRTYSYILLYTSLSQLV